MGALESAVYYSYLGRSEDTLVQELSTIGQAFDKKIKAAAEQQKEFILPCAIHILLWISVFDCLVQMADPGVIKDNASKYVSFARANLETISEEVGYFRKVKCHNKDNSRIIVRVEGPTDLDGRPPETLAINAYQLLRNYMKQKKFAFLGGWAPRNRKERDLLKLLEKFSVKADDG